MDLWSWQDDDVKRLRRAGKAALARYWDDPEATLTDVRTLREAAELARELGEPRWELLYWHWYVQQGLFRDFADPQSLATIGARLDELASDPTCADLPQRHCARESVCNLRQAVDRPGHAEEVLRIADRVLDVVEPGLECRECFVLLRGEALIELGQGERAERDLRDFVRTSGDPNRRFLALLHLAAASERAGDAEGMERTLADAEQRRRDDEVNADNEWFLIELRVRARVLAGDVDGALAYANAEGGRVPPKSAEGIRLLLTLARGFGVRARWEVAASLAADAARRALGRGLTRLAAEGSLLSAEALRALGGREEEAETHAAALSNLLPQLRSRDLDERARAVGAAFGPSVPSAR